MKNIYPSIGVHTRGLLQRGHLLHQYGFYNGVVKNFLQSFNVAQYGSQRNKSILKTNQAKTDVSSPSSPWNGPGNTCSTKQIEGHLGCFQVLDITKDAAMNKVEQMSLLYECASFGYMPKSLPEQGRAHGPCTKLIQNVDVNEKALAFYVAPGSGSVFIHECLTDSSMKQELFKPVIYCFSKFSSNFAVGPACPVYTVYS
ncbi:hypothetical protein H671_6g16995 [Cricetulus griseus]|nr:hypothetical protein H671_6g16995 [Cricetulus griseus]